VTLRSRQAEQLGQWNPDAEGSGGDEPSPATLPGEAQPSGTNE